MKALAIPARLAAFLPVVQKLMRGRYDVIHIHFLSQGVVGVLARKPFFAQAHGSDLHANLRNPAYRPVTRAVARRAKAIFYVTPNLPAFLDGFKSKLVYLPNPVELPAAPAPARVGRIVIFTRLHPIKGVEHIFPAAERLAAIGHVTTIANGPLKREYAALYANWVEFVAPVPHEDIAAFLAGFDVVIGQLRQGVLGLMEIEALSVGRPVIAAIDPALYADDPPPVINASSPDDIVTAIVNLRDHPELLADLSRRSHEWAVRTHGYRKHLEVLEKTYFGSA